MTDIIGSTSAEADHRALCKEWDEASCPICMDHPHNAVLLICSSHDKGCRSYICDTSYRHSNCLDRFKKLKAEPSRSPSHNSSPVESLDSRQLIDQNLRNLIPRHILSGPRMSRNLVEIPEENIEGIPATPVASQEENGIQSTGIYSETERMERVSDFHGVRPVGEDVGDISSLELTSQLKCPMCRGSVKGFEIVKEARQYLDMKQRNCSRDTCSFTGNYKELRRHARRVHPTTRPNDVDPSRQRAWHHLENQREYDDIVSAIRSAMPGAIMLGDYVIDSGDRSLHDGESILGESNRPWWATFFLFHMFGPLASDEPRRLSRAWRRHRHSSRAFSRQSNHWRADLLGMLDDDDEWNLGSDDLGDLPVPRRRRRLSRSRSEDQP